MRVVCQSCNRTLDTGEARSGELVVCACGQGILVPEMPAAAGKMNCPACGAPVDPALKRCIYCETALATVICPACFGLVFEGVTCCNHCGRELTARSVLVHGAATPHRCPRCEGRLLVQARLAHRAAGGSGEPPSVPEAPLLRVEVVAGCAIERCPACEGLWVDFETVERIYADREASPSLQSLTGASKPIAPTASSTSIPAAGAKAPASAEAGQGYIRCPACQKLMNKQNFGRLSGVIIDLCKGHGTWFDADELRRILAFIEAGGLDKQAQRERDALKEELRWLRQKRAIEATQASADVSMGGRATSGGLAVGLGRLLGKLLR
ncbi:MAG TPA: zinc ribbon domain-containing protein [Myxococcota bacterium]|nr:zinc ribbon domain-containing protein [Myxococcota bacterium]HRY92677.1 zinc ribbon domain-containing protein [Myxococcota bacterium]HSA21639.1 zinc ribbon domain-containing protein [Myxococcota bacterium]